MARGGGRQRAGRRADYEWTNFGDSEVSLDLSVASGVFGTSGGVVQRPGTIVRIRGKIAAQLDTTSADERALVLLGLMVVSPDGFATGAAPEIFTGGADDGRFLWQGALFLSSLAEAAVVEGDNLFASVDVDTKAMARVKANETVALIIHTPAQTTVDQGGVFDLLYFMHVLVAS